MKKSLSAILCLILSVCFVLTSCGEKKEVKTYDDLTIDKTHLELQVGEKYTYVVKNGETEINLEELVWQSSDETIATVEKGEVIAVKNGTTIITAIVDKKALTSTVTVKDKETTSSSDNTSSETPSSKPQPTTSKPQTTTPSQPQTTTPSQPQTTTPSQPQTTTPSQPQATTPSQPGWESINLSCTNTFPTNISRRYSDGDIIATIQVTDCSIEKTVTSDNKLLATIKFNCVKTYDEDGDFGTERVNMLLVLKRNGEVALTEKLMVYPGSPIVSQKLTYTFQVYLTPNNTYTFEVMEVN